MAVLLPCGRPGVVCPTHCPVAVLALICLRIWATSPVPLRPVRLSGLLPASHRLSRLSLYVCQGCCLPHIACPTEACTSVCQGCCLTEQWIFIGLFGGYLLLDLLLWRFWILLPFKMIAVFVHEVVAGWLAE